MLVELFIGSSPSVYHWDPNIQESVPEKVRRLISLTLYDVKQEISIFYKKNKK